MRIEIPAQLTLVKAVQRIEVSMLSVSIVGSALSLAALPVLSKTLTAFFRQCNVTFACIAQGDNLLIVGSL